MMKRIILLSIFVSVFTLGTFAQLSFGVKGGYATSPDFIEHWDLENNPTVVKCGAGHGYNLGGFLRFGDRAFGQVEALFAQQFSNYTIDNIKYDFKIQSINMPLLAGYKIIDTRNFNWRIMAGPTFHFSAGSKSDIPDIITPSNTVETDLRDYQIGLDCGIGLDIWALTVDVRYKLMQNAVRFREYDERVNKHPIGTFDISFGWKLFDATR